MRTLVGTIVSNRMAKTVVVRVDRLRKHAKYHKFFRASRTYKADVPAGGSSRMGDVVKIQESRPLSRDKRWKVIAVLRVAESDQLKTSDAVPEEYRVPQEP